MRPDEEHKDNSPWNIAAVFNIDMSFSVMQIKGMLSTRSIGRTDLIIDYMGKQYVIEMKNRHGNEYNTREEEQLLGYLKDYQLASKKTSKNAQNGRVKLPENNNSSEISKIN